PVRIISGNYPSPLFLLQPKAVKILPPVLKVSNTSQVVKLLQQVEIHIDKKGAFGIGSGFSLNAIYRERKIGGGEHRALGVLDVHVVYLRKIPHRACNRDITLILDGSGLGTESYAGITVLGVSHEGNEQDLHPLVGQDPGDLGELNIVTDQHTHLSAVGIHHPQFASALHPPRRTLGRGDMQLFIPLIASISSAQVSDVEHVLTDDLGHAASDDVDVVGDGEIAEGLQQPVGIG